MSKTDPAPANWPFPTWKGQPLTPQLESVTMKNYVVLYRIESIMCPADAPFGFQCYAEDTDHAEEQCENAHPDADIVWVWEGPEGIGMESALDSYWASETVQEAP